MLQPEEITGELRAFILELNFGIPVALDSDTDLFEAGLLDSLTMANLIGFCEERFECSLDIADLTEDSFRSIATISQLVSRKLTDSKDVASDQPD